MLQKGRKTETQAVMKADSIFPVGYKPIQLYSIVRMSLCSYSQRDSVALWAQLFHSVTEGTIDHSNFLKNVKKLP